ncbi:protein arginine kinase [Tichowtungia aerotolerans]|uniref:Protein-arginine kinase n=1 Tax=Tichowtungia aerotolerans TaxID=2697043 RepID=A0A6P1M361_9BACT|nr:protein arginine kinase [Tichowtungia aerotolerans]QHI68261.1 protein arginine kinase [Tichowtungia aerotolerans]
MTLDGLLERHGGWLESGPEEGPVISSRVRLARNLSDTTFPGWASKEVRDRVWNEVVQAFDSMETDTEFLRWRMDELKTLERELLFERHLISAELAERKSGSGLFVSEDECRAVMVNEEDHIRLQSLQPGLNLQKALDGAEALDDDLEKTLTYAFSSKLGYLTACPSNVGTGMRASVMLHLPGLCLTEEIKPVINAVSKIGLAVRGMWGEGSEAAGHMFQISNQITLGKTEVEIISHLDQIVLEVIEHEKNARLRLMESQQIRVHDHIGRAYGILAHAAMMNSNEALDLLSGLRLGIDLGLMPEIARRDIDQLLIRIQPAHLQKAAGSMLSPEERDIKRAQLIRLFLDGSPDNGNGH